MLRSVLSAIALAGVFAVAQPAFADPAAAAPDQTQFAAPAMQQPAPPPPARASSPDAPAPVNPGSGKTVVFVGFGRG
jgi:hypothetical protein